MKCDALAMIRTINTIHYTYRSEFKWIFTCMKFREKIDGRQLVVIRDYQTTFVYAIDTYLICYPLRIYRGNNDNPLQSAQMGQSQGVLMWTNSPNV